MLSRLWYKLFPKLLVKRLDKEIRETFKGWIEVTIRDWLYDQYTEKCRIRRPIGNGFIEIKQTEDGKNSLMLEVIIFDKTFSLNDEVWLAFDISYNPTRNNLTVSSVTQEILNNICDAFIPVLMK